MFRRSWMLLAAVALFVPASQALAQSYKLDPDHCTAVFRIHHFNAGYVWGMISAPTGSVRYDEADDSKMSFHVKASVDRLDTGNKQRDDDLKGQDWFNAKQFPDLSFDSDSVKKAGDHSYTVTGKLSIHGVTKPVTVTMDMTGEGKGMKGESRRGFESTFTINRNDYDVKALPGAVGDEVRIIVAIEGVEE